MGRRALITGVQGFTGRYLAAELSLAGYEIFGTVHKKGQTTTAGMRATYVCDLCDPARLAEVIEEVQPDVVAHLAAIAFVAHGDANAIYTTNLIGSRNLLDALSRASKPVRAVLLASSANVYGNSSEGVLDETTPLAPANDYAVSKLAMEHMARLYQGRLPITIARPFNYTGVGQDDNFLLPKIVSHVKHHAPVIELGNLQVARDFSDVRVVVQYYRRLLETPSTVGETYNVCSGVAYTLDQVLNMVRTIAGYDFEVRVNPAFVRPNEVKLLVGNRNKLDTAVGQIDSVDLINTLEWMIR